MIDYSIRDRKALPSRPPFYPLLNEAADLPSLLGLVWPIRREGGFDEATRWFVESGNAVIRLWLDRKPIRHLGKESPAISTVFSPGPVASDPASESVSVDAPAKKADSYYYGITFDSYP